MNEQKIMTPETNLADIPSEPTTHYISKNIEPSDYCAQHLTAPITDDPWSTLRQFTDARIGLGRCGVSLPVKEWLNFRLAHACARDAVFMPLQSEKLLAAFAENHLECLHLKSAVQDKNEFLTRPDKGRRLSDTSRERLAAYKREHPNVKSDICIVISDGLSAQAVHDNAVPFALTFAKQITDAGLSLAPVVLAELGRVAVADEVASCLGARLAVLLIGERPGLSAPNSLSVYMTYNPAIGKTDEMRNCISNIRNGCKC